MSNTIFQYNVGDVGYVVVAKDHIEACGLIAAYDGTDVWREPYEISGPTESSPRVVAAIRKGQGGTSTAKLFGYNEVQADFIIAQAAYNNIREQRERDPYDPSRGKLSGWQAQYPLDDALLVLGRAEHALCSWGFGVVMADDDLRSVLEAGVNLYEHWLEATPVWVANKAAVLDVFLSL